jgi:hypothetical protein
VLEAEGIQNAIRQAESVGAAEIAAMIRED